MASKRVRLAQHRRAAGFSQEKLAQHLGVERTTVVRWESAETEPQPWLRPRLAKAIRVTGHELEELLGDIALLSTEPDERMSYVLAHPASVDLMTVAYLHERISQLTDQYDRSPSTSLLGPAGQTHGQVRYLRENSSKTRTKKALYELEAESAIFMGQLVWDASQRRDNMTSITYFDEAVNTSRQARDPCIQAYATLRKSFVALYGEKDPVKGLTLAEESAEIARLSSPSLTGLALLHVAEGYAMSNNIKSCENALKKAETQFGRVCSDDITIDCYSISEFDRLTGSCYLFLDLPERAEPILRQTTQALVDKKKSQTIALGNLTLALIRQRKLDEAAATMHRTIDAVELTRGGGGFNVTFAAGRELQEWRDKPWVRDINDRLLALMATT